jgi:proteasome lid subunit RPN8/RPN11
MSKYDELLTAMGTHSLAQFPNEACGIITKDLGYVPCRNISSTPRTSFIIDPLAILKHENDILGFFHSHPGASDPIPSTKDLPSTAFYEYLFVVGFGTNFYKYWHEDNRIKFEKLNENHFNIL